MAADKDQLSEMLDRYHRADDCTRDLYDQARGDIRFVTIPGAQWDDKLKSRRGDRPTYEFPKLQGHVRQVVNSMRQTRPQGKVRGVEESDTGLAEIMNGLCRNILDVSNADLAHDIAYEKAVQGGMGWWRIRTRYETEDSFDQSIYIEPLRNPFAVKMDPAANAIDRRDALFAFVEEWLPDSEFERQFPKAKKQDFDGDSSAKLWKDAHKTRVAEYWYKTPVKRTLLALSTGQTVWQDETDVAALQAGGIQIVKQRLVDSHTVNMRLTNGCEWLTEEREFPCKFIPLVPVWGMIDLVDDEEYWQGIVRQSKDLQRLHNVHRTAVIEAVAKAPKAPFIAKLKWIKGLESLWKRANEADFPVLPVNDDADGMPQRAAQAEIPAALIQLGQMDNDDIKAATGIFDPSLGSQSNETSGVAIARRQSQSAVSTFNYIDNLSYAIRFEYEILIDMIPRVYDTPRVVRVLGSDGAEEWKQLYQTVIDPVTGQPSIVNDVSKGKYDITVTVGPSYPTQRMEAVSAFSQLVGQLGPSFPPLAMLLAYEVVKNLDLPGNEEVLAAVRQLLVGQGLLKPEDGEQPPQQGPNPMQQAQMQKIAADTMLKVAQARKTQAETQVVVPSAQADIEKTLADAGHTHAKELVDVTHAQMDSAVPPYWHMKPTPPQPGGIDTNFQPPQGGF